MNVYNDIRNTYINNVNDINLIVFDITTEAEEINDDTNKKNTTSSFIEKISKLFQKILNILDNIIMKIRNGFTQAMLTDKGFQKQLSEAQRNRKPLNGIKVITYTYQTQFLETVHLKLKNIVQGIINSYDPKRVMDENNPLGFNKDKMESFILQKLGVPNDVTNIDEFFIYIKKFFRGEKSEKTIMNSTIPKHVQIIQSYKQEQNKLNTELQNMRSTMIQVRTKIRTFISSQDVADEAKRKATQQISNLTYLLNLFSSYIHLHFELIVELMTNSRIILKKLYQF